MPIFMPPTTGSFSPCPEGSFIAICYRIVDLGTQEVVFQGHAKYTRQLLLSWELPEELMSDGRPFTISKKYTYSSHPKASLRKDLESWRGKRFSDDEIEGFDIGNLIGVGCMLS